MTNSSANAKGLREWARQAVKQAEGNLAGLSEVAKLCLVAYCTRGHVLLEGNPGLGKTTLVKELAKALGLPWGRIQFTPDLMPSDITGTFQPDYQSGDMNRWGFNPGPVFTSLLLADEINRATPKTQAALLEAMAEGQVTVLGQTYRLPKPFVVMATQNPIDQVGTYALPEAQADRFMFKILMPLPDKHAVAKIIKYNHLIGKEDDPPLASSNRPLYVACNQKITQGVQLSAPEEAIIQRYFESRKLFMHHAGEVDRIGMPDDPKQQENDAFVGLHEHVRIHIINLFMASNRRLNEVEGLDEAQRRRAKAISDLFAYGLGPRAVINLMRAARAWALLFGSANAADPDRVGDAEALAHVVAPILRHRVKLGFDWQDQYQSTPERGGQPTFSNPDDPLAGLIADFCVSTAPSTAQYAHYRELLIAALAQVLGQGGRRR